MATQKYPSVPAKTLIVDLASGDTTIIIDNINDWNDNALTADQFAGDYIAGALINDSKSLIEFILIDATTITSAATTGATIFKRGLNLYATGVVATDQAEVTANKLDWTAGETKLLIGTNAPYLLGTFINRYNAEAISGKYTFSVVPASSAAPVAGDDLVNLTKLNATALGSASIDQQIIAAVAGETVTVGQVVYQDPADQEWKLADASSAATSENVTLAIAQGGGTDGVAISGGVLTLGRDTKITGMTAGKIFLSDTAGAVSSSTGTVEVTLGVATDATTLNFFPRYDQVLTEDQQDALVGTSGTPSATNKYVTADDVAATSTAGKIVRMNGSGKLADGISNISDADATTLTGGGNADSEHIHSGASRLITINDINTSDTNELTVFTTSLAGGSLGTTGVIKGKLFISGRHQNGNWVVKLKYGATTLITLTHTGTWASSESGWLDFIITADGATGAQNASMGYYLTNVTGDATEDKYDFGTGTATEDSTGALTLALTIQVTNTTNTEINVLNGVVELIS